MTCKVILTAIGNDRPGLTQALADAVFEAGGNWLESHLSHLGGHYVGSVLVELSQEAVPALEQVVDRVTERGLHVSIVPAEDRGSAPQQESPAMSVEVVGQDRAGIVREVTTVLARLGANIEEFTSSVDNGAWSGERLFRARMQVSLPEGVSPEDARGALEAISGEIMVDFQ